MEFHDLEKENELECLLLGLNFLLPNVSEIWLGKHQIKLKINKLFHIIRLNKDNQKLIFRAKESFEVGACLIQCSPSSFVFAASVYNVPIQYQQLLGMTRIKLTSGSIKKSTQQSTFRQTFVFEIDSIESFHKDGEVFELHGPIGNNENFDHNCAMQTFPSVINDPNYVELHGGQVAHLPRRWNPWYIQDAEKRRNSVSTCSETKKCRKCKFEGLGLPSRSPNSHHKGDSPGLHHKASMVALKLQQNFLPTRSRFWGFQS